MPMGGRGQAGAMAMVPERDAAAYGRARALGRMNAAMRGLALAMAMGDQVAWAALVGRAA